VTEHLPQCGAVCEHLVCDRERGHLGQHRGYDANIDEPIFWGVHMRRRDPGTEAIDYFEHAPIDAAAALLAILTGIVARRRKAAPPIETTDFTKGKPLRSLDVTGTTGGKATTET